MKIAPATDSEYGVGFALDLHPVLNGQRVDGVPLTAAGLLDWLGGNANLEVSRPTATSIENLPATAGDIHLSKAAVNDDPGCPARACVNFLGFPQWDHANGIAGDDVYRLYLADVRYSGTDHVFLGHRRRPRPHPPSRDRASSGAGAGDDEGPGPGERERVRDPSWPFG